MTPSQAHEIEQLQAKLKMSDGQLLDLAWQCSPDCGCEFRSLADLTRFQSGTLLGKLREIETKQSRKETLVSAQ